MTDRPDTQSEVSPKDASFWLAEIAASQSRMDGWYKKAEEAEKRYRAGDEDDGTDDGLNIYWANVETQRAAIGEDFGSPEVTRVNMPEDDGGLARHVALVWQRSIAAAVRDTDDNHDISLAVGDVFQPGRGQAWLEVEKSENGWVSASLVRVMYRDYLEGASTRWGSVPWVARRHMFTKDELISECKLTEAEADKVPLNVTLPHDDSKDKPEKSAGKEQFQRAEVFEVWTKFPKKARLYVAVGYADKVLRYDPDPLKIKGFFPCPRPMLANGDESKPPLTDYSRYQTQAEELDIICDRITVLTAALERKGVHDKQFKELADLAEASENTTVAVENWADFQAKGGLNKLVEWQDILPLVQVLAELHKQRSTLIQLIYELSGISDLARGHTDPDETATAQQLKQTFGSSRFKRREKESRRFASECYQIKGEVIAELFPREQLQEMSGIPLPLQKEIDDARRQLQQIMGIQQQAEQARQQLQQLQQAQSQPGFVPPAPEAVMRLQAQAKTPPPDQEQLEHLTRIAKVRFSWEKVSGVLQSDYRRCYSVTIETDQSAFVDQEADKAARSQFFANVMAAMKEVAPLIAGNPKNGEVFKNLVMFNISAFKAGRSMEEGIEQAIDAAIQHATQQQGQQQQPSPDAIKLQIAQVGLQTAQVKLQTEQQRAQNAAVKSQAEAAQGQMKAVQEGQKTQALQDQNQAKRTGQQIDNIGKTEKLQFERETRATAQEALLYGPTQTPSGAAL